MPRYRFFVAVDPEAPAPPLETLPSVAAHSPREAVAKLANQGRLPIAGDGLLLRLVSEDAEHVLPLCPQFELPIDWQPDD